MDLSFKQYIPEDFSPSSRIWIYQSNRLLSIPEVMQADEILQEFVGQWATHGTANKGFARILFGQFIVLMADESSHTVSGCSTDSSVRVIKQLESLLKVNLFDRQLLAFVVKDKVQCIPMNQLNYAIEHEFVTADTLYFNNLVQTKQDFLDKWIIPISKSWLASKLSLKANA
ncbi:MAG: hypothetical protein DI598_13510 [Pseudopedobacter saltans]|uniref:ABC transporter ATPase n=1 Tax=Pseudopedobacter saltans TaxID=151895 RepID=A0A2W5EUP4_9SPHI|nr:MAG: hypothetical protein DI598_13510 [Pseudopedobacter saltans]